MSQAHSLTMIPPTAWLLLLCGGLLTVQASPAKKCIGKRSSYFFLGDTINPCVFYQCDGPGYCRIANHNNRYHRRCPPGTAVPNAFFSQAWPCVKSKNRRVCNYAYRYYKGRRSLHGKLARGVDNVSDCLDQCVGTCRAADFDLRLKLCYHHTFATACNNGVAGKHFVHYRLRPCPKCRRLPNRCRRCRYGNVRNKKSCQICRCRKKGCRPLHKSWCRKACTYGHKRNKQGCRICSCIPKLGCRPMSRDWCKRRCKYGYVKNIRKCEICRCFKPTCRKVTTRNCKLRCQYGLLKNKYGCAICACRTRCKPGFKGYCKKKCQLGHMLDGRGCSVCRCNLKRCPPLCKIRCKYGHMIQNGCRICKCRRRRNCKGLNRLTCRKVCRYGYRRDLDGCPTCDCRQRCKPNFRRWCSLECRFGYVRNRHGCRTCQCRTRRCKLVNRATCPRKCRFGYRRNVRGCPICSCLHCRVLTAVNCKLRCRYGYRRNKAGCTICQCKRRCAPNFRRWCSRSCKFGYMRNGRECRRCVCRKQRCKGINKSSCKRSCKYGYLRDKNGCFKCECKKPSKCRRLTPGRCRRICIYGYRKNSKGCRVCRCRRKCRPNFRARCPRKCSFGFRVNRRGCRICRCRVKRSCRPLFRCTKKCPNGYLRNRWGCRICACRKKRKCSPLRCRNKCLFGRQRNRRGCPICACQKFKKFNRKHIIGAKIIRGKRTWQKCLAACKLPCRAIDFNRKFKTCWHHTSKTACKRFSSNNNVDHYRLRSCRKKKCKILNRKICKIQCAFGFATNKYGCKICACKRRLFACENKRLNLKCGKGFLLHIISANYGKKKKVPTATLR